MRYKKKQTNKRKQENHTHFYLLIIRNYFKQKPVLCCIVRTTENEIKTRL